MAPARRSGRGGRPRDGGSAPTIDVDVNDRQRILRIGRASLERLVRRVLACEGIEAAEIGILLVDDRRIAAMHGRWLGDGTPTDVITFDLSDADVRSGGLLRGDIVASTETARRVARDFGWTPRQEVAYYVVHGLLHLTGYDDRTPGRRRAMRARERSVMKTVGLPPPPRARRRGMSR